MTKKEEQIAELAYYKFIKGGGQHGNDLNDWLEAEKDHDSLKEFMDRYIYGVKSFTEYLEKCGGNKRILELRNEELLF